MKRERTRSSRLIAAVVVLVVIAVATSTPGFSFLEGILSGKTAKGAVLPTTTEGAAYVGSVQCQQCHAGTYKGWKTTMHPYKIQDIEDVAVVFGDFEKNNKLVIKRDGVEYTTTMSKNDGKYYITTIGSDGEEYTYEVEYTIGGGQWKQRYATVFPNGEVHILPVQWNVEKQEWADYHGLKGRNYDADSYWSDKGRIWQLKCMGCHATGGQVNYDEETDTYASTWENGIGCEACHGPGSNHVLATTENKVDTIVNPAKIPQKDVGVMVCGACHNRGAATASYTAGEYEGKYGYPFGYKPGMNLEPLYTSVTPEKDTPKRFWPSGDSASHHQQYLDWKTSEHARAGIACWDCHTHSKGEGKYQTKLAGTALCKSCHGEIRDGATKTHSIHDFGNCVDCHMAPTAKSINPGDIRSHTFKPILPEVTIAAGGLEKQPNSCNSCHHHEDETAETMLSKMRGMM